MVTTRKNTAPEKQDKMQEWLRQYSYVEKTDSIRCLTTEEEVHVWVYKKKLTYQLFNFTYYELTSVSQEMVDAFCNALLFHGIHSFSFFLTVNFGKFSSEDWERLGKVLDAAHIKSLTAKMVGLHEIPVDLWPLACSVLTSPSLISLDLSANQWHTLAPELRELFYVHLEKSNVRSLIMKHNGLEATAMEAEIKRINAIIGNKLNLKDNMWALLFNNDSLRQRFNENRTQLSADLTDYYDSAQSQLASPCEFKFKSTP